MSRTITPFTPAMQALHDAALKAASSPEAKAKLAAAEAARQSYGGSGAGKTSVSAAEYPAPAPQPELQGVPEHQVTGLE